MSEENLWYFSRGDSELYDKCPYARYNRTIRFGRGMIKIGSSFELSLGRIVHKATEFVLLGSKSLREAARYAEESILKVVMAGEVPKKVPVEFQDQFSREAQCLTGGLVWMWGLHVLPSLMAQFDIVSVEGRTTFKKDGMALPTVGDLLLRDKTNPDLYVYPDWKTAAWVNNAWIDSWNRSAQLHTTAAAMEQTTGHEIAYCYVQALVKGRWERDRQQSPLCWAQFNPEPDEAKRAYRGQPLDQWVWEHTARKQWIRTPQWMSGMSIEQWCRAIPRGVALTLVPRTPPIIIDPHLVDTWWRQRVIKEKRIKEAKGDLINSTEVWAPDPDRSWDAPGWQGTLSNAKMEAMRQQEHQAIIDDVFPQVFTQCKPVVGFTCDYYENCHETGIGEDPLGSGIYRPRPTYEQRIKEESANND